jgi:hypothetical protein
VTGDDDITLKKGDIEIVLRYDVDDDELLWSLKDRDDPPSRYRIIVKVNGDKLVEYVRTFDKPPGTGHLNNFLKKVARDPSYREQYLENGSWDGIVEWTDPVNPSTKKAIDRLNRTSMKKLRFKDFARLKVGGRDSFSRRREDDLDAIIDHRDVKLVNDEFPVDDKMREVAKRWIARGLRAGKAVRKVKTDDEIRANVASSRR